MKRDCAISGWPAEPVAVPQSGVSRIYQLQRSQGALRTDRRPLLSQVPDELATSVGIAMGIDGMQAHTNQRGEVAISMWNMVYQQSESESSRMQTTSLHRLYLLDTLFHNYVSNLLTASEVTAMAEVGHSEEGCAQLLFQFSLARLATALREREVIDAWRCDWLAWQALGNWIGAATERPKTPAPVAVDSFQLQMPVHAAILEIEYAKWLDRKDWMQGELMSGSREQDAPAFERPNGFVSSWLVTVKLATGLQLSTEATVETVLAQLQGAGHPSLVEQFFVGLCDDQMYRLYQSAEGGFQHAPEWLKGAGADWGLTLALNNERKGVFSRESTFCWWSPKGALEKSAIEFVRSVLLKVTGQKPLSWFYERPVQEDGYREINPGWPTEQYLGGQKRGCIELRDDDNVMALWVSERARGALIDSPMPCYQFAVEVWNKKDRRVDAAATGILYQLPNKPKNGQKNIELVLSAAYSLSQHQLLFFVDAMRQHDDLQDLVAAGSVAVIDGWERHAESKPGVGVLALKLAVETLANNYEDLGSVILKVDPLQFSPLAGGEPPDIQAARNTAFHKIVEYTRQVFAPANDNKVRLRYVDPQLNGDIQDVLRDTELPASAKAILNNVLFTRALYGGW